MSLNPSGVHLTEAELCKCCKDKLHEKIKFALTVICEICNQNCYLSRYETCDECNKYFCIHCMNEICSPSVDVKADTMTYKFKCCINSDTKLLNDEFSEENLHECSNFIIFKTKWDGKY